MLFSKKINTVLKNKAVQLKLVDDQTPTNNPRHGETPEDYVNRISHKHLGDQNSPPIVEEGITLSKSDILTAVVVLTLVNGVVAMGVAKIAKGGE